MPTLLVTGANGQLGSELQQLAPQTEYDWIFTDREELDITDAGAVNRFMAANSVDVVLNCAAYTAVDKAEAEPDVARAINAIGPSNLAEACAKRKAWLIQVSTDYVYHQHPHNRPLVEEDDPAPLGVYASTKLEGERAAQVALPNCLIVRTAWVYSSFGHNFVKTMLRLGKERKQVKVIFDQVGSPTYARDLAKALLHIVKQREEQNVPESHLQGIYHYSNEGACSWYDFAQAIFDIQEIDCKVVPIETKDYLTPAERPPFSLLNKAKIKATFGIAIPHWRHSLQGCLAKLDESGED